MKKTVYETTESCDACGKVVKTLSGDVDKTSYIDMGGGFLGININYGYNDFCKECTKSFEEWKKSRKS